MKLYTITENYTYYKGSDATAWGIYPTLKAAKKALKEILSEKFDYILDDLYDGDKKEFNKWIKNRFVEDEYSLALWIDDDDDSVTKFYIDVFECDFIV